MDNYKEAKSIYEFSAKDLCGEVVSLKKFEGYVCLIINILCKGTNTDNYLDGLTELHDKYSSTRGLKILAFPCSQFSNEEPSCNEDINEYIKNHNIPFMVFEKVDVNGSSAHPLWKYLKWKLDASRGNFIKWNFTKFVINKTGQVVERIGPSTEPKDVVKYLEKYW